MEIFQEEDNIKFFLYHSEYFLPILEMKVFTLLLAISKWFELRKPDWAHLVDFLMKINLPFLKTFLAFLEVEISLKEHDPKSLF